MGLSGRYRDSDFYIPEHQVDGNRSFEEQEFSVKGGTNSQLDGAVLDLMADDQVSFLIFSAIAYCRREMLASKYSCRPLKHLYMF